MFQNSTPKYRAQRNVLQSIAYLPRSNSQGSQGRGTVVNVNRASPIVDGCYFWASMTAYEKTISIVPYSTQVTLLHG